MQELRAPDVMSDEDILILTKTEMLKPGRNLLCSPEVNCQRRKSRSALSTQNPKGERKVQKKRTPRVLFTNRKPKGKGKQYHNPR